MHFGMKNILKNNRKHTPKKTLKNKKIKSKIYKIKRGEVRWDLWGTVIDFLPQLYTLPSFVARARSTTGMDSKCQIALL
jgi:hypothetical protein